MAKSKHAPGKTEPEALRPGLQPHRVRELRIALGLNQPELASMVGVFATYIGAIERGINNPSSSVVAALTVALRTNADYLLGLTEDKSPRK